MQTNGSNEHRPARKMSYSIPDVLNKGLELILQPGTDITTEVGGAGVGGEKRRGRGHLGGSVDYW